MADHDQMILRLADRQPVASLEELAARCHYPVLALKFAPTGLGGPHASVCEERGMLTYQILYGEAGVGSPLLRMFGRSAEYERAELPVDAAPLVGGLWPARYRAEGGGLRAWVEGPSVWVTVAAMYLPIPVALAAVRRLEVVSLGS